MRTMVCLFCFVCLYTNIFFHFSLSFCDGMSTGFFLVNNNFISAQLALRSSNSVFVRRMKNAICRFQFTFPLYIFFCSHSLPLNRNKFSFTVRFWFNFGLILLFVLLFFVVLMMEITDWILIVYFVCVILMKQNKISHSVECWDFNRMTLRVWMHVSNQLAHHSSLCDFSTVSAYTYV